ncbi:MAG: hypothetical protein JOZ73_11055 [Solirubrobacterales bacterium]|nr:hypothetical protein [Solirubrobacterales bacterium]
MTSITARAFPENQTLRSLAARLSRPRDPLEWPLLLLALAAGGALLFHLTRGMTFQLDEWVWVLGRRGWSAGTLLDPHNGHLSLVPLLIYKVLFATAGLKHYAAYRLAAIAGHLACVTLVYLFVRRRSGWLLALSAAVLVMLLGSGWENILSPFQVAWTVALAAGIAALLMLERRTRGGDIAASTFVALSIASTSIGLAVAAGMAVQIALSRRRWRDEWIVVVPLLLYGAWFLSYHKPTPEAGSVYLIAQYTAVSIADTFSALLGLAGDIVRSNSSGTTLLLFGAPLALAGSAWFVVALRRRSIHPGAAPALAVMLLVFSVLTALTRALIAPVPATRYLYVDAVLAILIIAELSSAFRPRPAARGVLVLVAGIATLSNLAEMRTAAANQRLQGLSVNAEVGALNLSQAFVGPGYIPAAFPGWPLVRLYARDIYAAERQLGPMGFSAGQLASMGGLAGKQADSEMINNRQLQLRPAQPTPTARSVHGPTLTLEGASFARVARRGGCVLMQGQFVTPGEQSQVEVTLPPMSVSVHAVRGDASVGLRRFGPQFIPAGTATAGSAASLRIPYDGLAYPWHLQVSSMGEAEVCPLG